MATHLKCSPNLCNLQLSYQKKKKKEEVLEESLHYVFYFEM